MNANISMKIIKHIQGNPLKKIRNHYNPSIFIFSSLLLVSATHLYILRKLPEHKTMANLVSRRLLQTITKITSKKNVPEIITFRYTTKEEEEQGEEQQQVKSKNKPKTKIPIDCDKVYIPDAGDATKNIKILIMKALHMFDEPTEPASS